MQFVIRFEISSASYAKSSAELYIVDVAQIVSRV